MALRARTRTRARMIRTQTRIDESLGFPYLWTVDTMCISVDFRFTEIEFYVYNPWIGYVATNPR